MTLPRVPLKLLKTIGYVRYYKNTFKHNLKAISVLYMKYLVICGIYNVLRKCHCLQIVHIFIFEIVFEICKY